ncbi:MFS transporter [Domibacillus indicus]|uniref:MFS transporter n=1 Tax=Domibacillus indicus TaxID=1437523 RepID=UPI00203B2400|nr:MFS transporter [Domibacillus indicus]MCM3787164.1 MFS transporter [Domibacillus indicus]
MNKRSQRLFLLISFLFWFSHFIYIPMLSPYIEQIGGTYTFIGIVLASYGLMQFLFRLPIGIGSDLWNKRKGFVVAGMAVSMFSCLAFALTESLGWVLLSRSLAGIAAATWVAFTILFSSYAAERNLHRAMGHLSFAVVFAQLLGMALSAWIVEEWGWHAPYWFGVAFGAAGLLLSLFVAEGKTETKREPVRLKELGTALKEPALLKVSLLSILAHSIMFTTMFGFTTDYALSAGMRAGDITILVFAFMVPHAVSTLLSGSWFVPKLGKWGTLQVAFSAAAIFTFFMPFADTKAALMGLQLVNGFALGLLFPLFLGMAVEEIPHAKRATAMGAYQALYAIGMFAGPFLAGILNTYFGLEASFYFSGAVGVLGALFSFKWQGEMKTESIFKHNNESSL